MKRRAVKLPKRAATKAAHELEKAVGGPARTRVVVLFACVLALESADLSAIGALGPQLQSSLGATSVELGLLAAVSMFVGAVMTVPFGVLADRVRRVDLLAVAVATWAVAMVAAAASQSYLWLLLSRIGLGAVTAAAAPTIASMLGDFFHPRERGRIYGYVLSGELVGTGFGFAVSGGIGGALSWRWGFAVLAIPAAALAWALHRLLAEPARGGQSRLQVGAQSVSEVEDLPAAPPDGSADATPRARDEAREAIAAAGATPDRSQLLHGDPARMGLGQVIRYVLSIPTNRWLIIASAIGYFFFAGMRTFVVVFARGHYGLSQGGAITLLFVAGLGSLVAVLISGRVADRRIRRGHVTARVVIPAGLYLAAALFLLPAIALTTLFAVVPLLILGAACLSAPNPPLDAARLDIMPSRLWGRAEGIRSLLRQGAQAGAPLLFGVLADVLGGAHNNALSSGSAQRVSAATARGLEYTFLVMLVPLVINGVLLLMVPRRAYPDDVAAAVASEAAVSPRSPAATA